MGAVEKDVKVRESYGLDADLKKAKNPRDGKKGKKYERYLEI